MCISTNIWVVKKVYMSLNVQDLLALHKIVNRQVRDERDSSFYFMSTM